MTQTLVSGLALGSVYVIFTLGLSLVWGVFKLLNLAYGALFALGAYTAYVVAQRVPLPLVVLAPLVMLATGLVAALLDVVFFRPIRRRNALPAEAELAMLIASIGVAGLPVAIIEYRTGGVPVFIAHSVFTIHTYTVVGIKVTNLQLILLALTLVIGAALIVVVRSTRAGRAMRSVSADPQTSELFGIHPSRVALAVMGISGALAGLAGVLLALYQSSVTAEMGDGLLLKAFAIIVIGGVGSLPGTIVGGFGLGVLETLVVAYGPASYRDAIAFGLIIAVLLLRPGGIFADRHVVRA